jgi:hypothetical protein
MLRRLRRTRLGRLHLPPALEPVRTYVRAPVLLTRGALLALILVLGGLSSLGVFLGRANTTAVAKQERQRNDDKRAAKVAELEAKIAEADREARLARLENPTQAELALRIRAELRTIAGSPRLQRRFRRELGHALGVKVVALGPAGGGMLAPSSPSSSSSPTSPSSTPDRPSSSSPSRPTTTTPGPPAPAAAAPTPPAAPRPAVDVPAPTVTTPAGTITVPPLCPNDLRPIIGVGCP